MDFLIDRRHDGQFHHIYRQRLDALQPAVARSSAEYCRENRIETKKTIAELKKEMHCLVVGVLYLETPNKKSIPDELFAGKTSDRTYSQDGAEFYLEDRTGRIRLLFASPQTVVTGIVVGVCCTCTAPDEATVHRVFLPGLAEQKHWPAPRDGRIAFVSGLCFGAPETLLRTRMLFDWVQNAFEAEQVSDVVLLGSIFCPPAVLSEGKYGGPPVFSTDHFDALDRVLSSLGSDKKIHVVPGETDPTNTLLPQQPLSLRFFPRTAKKNTLKMHTNPALLDLDGCRVLCVSGQPLNEMEKCFEAPDTLGLMERTLHWQHIAPAAPDTLPCYPLADKDPFVLGETPHVYVSSNRKTFAEKTLAADGKKVAIASLPDYAGTGCVFCFDRNRNAFEAVRMQP
ncbi:MAG: DNA polymerase delta small subunit [Amphiamblys sp. WSBS2006]|nr:MAG: DNA polymerase delta small subunit [Amphiamblys sp. WSBS2006]